jgi:hypothetical protein
MIVRLMGEGQYRIDEDLQSRLNELDAKAVEAIDQEDEPTLDRLLDEMAQLVRDGGEQLPADDLSPSDLIIPPSDLTLEETRALFSEEGLIPDLPSR